MLNTILSTLLLAAPMGVESPNNIPDIEKAATAAAESIPPAETVDRKEIRWIDRWAPEPLTLDLGVFGGLMPFHNHELFEADMSLPEQGWKPLPPVSPEVGARIGFYPGRIVGFEAEVSWLPTHLADGTGHVNIWAPRGHLVIQVPRWSVVPFVLAGAGAMIIDTPREVLGADVDPTFYWGGGVKVNVSRHFSLRLDLRDVISFKRGAGVGFNANTFEGLVGATWTIGRDKPAKRAKTVCRKCPIVEVPKALPPELAKFNGIIKGIHFDLDKDTIRDRSRPILVKAAKVLNKFDDVDVLIIGHTDNWGTHGHNVDLSTRRALRVKRFLVANGVASSRISTDGKSFDVPIASNKTKRGRALNRRIVFQIED